ncbi:glutathione S-transferase family protein [Psychrosphaera aestuarii]|uniref:glutathione S-transferase family protein n=1 Tax=Psychrosphaera aestuarii TaxID=1266052 RepID=UPI001B326D64|nr:glutathione S-transferase family protein [Psychrosphaera aestuarii]
MKLYGSITSPYVRRLRILLAQTQYEFEAVNIFGESREALKEINPTLKIPMFEDASNPNLPILLDSNLAYEYISELLDIPALDWSQKNDLALINSCNDSLVNMMILTRSGVDTSDDKLYFNIQRERCASTFHYFNKKISDGKLQDWNYITISLFVLIEWAGFRNLFDFSSYESILKFVEENQHHVGVSETAPSE